jgi:hypothetical protein
MTRSSVSNVATLPSDGLRVDVYVALSRGRGCVDVCLLQNFDDERLQDCEIEDLDERSARWRRRNGGVFG